ncbi:MAG: cell wall hydrolase [Bacillota bacterium]
MNRTTQFIAVLMFLICLIYPFSQVLFAETGPGFTLIYVVQGGDTIYDIAREYGISVEQIKEKNKFEDKPLIKAGQELVIASSTDDRQKKVEKSEDKRPDWNYEFFEDSGEEQQQYSLEVGEHYAVRYNPRSTLPEVDIPSSQIITYHVSMGDTLFDLARSFDTTVGVIMALNDMETNTLKKGQELKLPINNLSPKQVLARTVSSREIELMARAIHGEARGEPLIGQVAVGAVIINRVLSPIFPNSFRDVIYQSGQFSAVDDGQIKLKPSETAYRAARTALQGKDPTKGALYYYNPRTASDRKWFSQREAVVTIGKHEFAK